MKLTSKPFWWVAQYLKRKNVKQAAIVMASLFGINEVYGIAVTAPLIAETLYGIIRNKIRGKHGKSKSRPGSGNA